MVTILHRQRYGYDVVIYTSEHGPHMFTSFVEENN